MRSPRCDCTSDRGGGLVVIMHWILVRPSRCLTRCPPQYLKALHQLLAFVRRCQAPPERGQHCPRVRWWRIRHRSQRELALSLPAAEPIERLVAIRRRRDHNRQSRQGSRAPRPSWRSLPLRQKFPEPLAARADIDITPHRSDRADHHRSGACTCQPLA
jgi:hypothetical protein